MSLNEDTLVSQTTADYLRDELGWESVYAYNTEVLGPDGTLGRDDEREVILRPTLQRKLEELNPGLPAHVYTDAIKQLTAFSTTQTALQINRQKHKLLRDGITVQYRDADGIQQRPTLRVFDFEDPTQNEFLAVRELWVKGDVYRRRPDMVGFVNGVPLVVMEFKNVDKALRTAYDNNISDYRDTIPHLLHCNAFVILGNGDEARYGTFTSPYEYFHEWKRLDEDEPGIVDMETLLKGICSKEGLLELFEHFILFDESKGDPVKIAARNHQVLGVRQAYRAITSREVNESKLGVFWHTQGSGKSLSMVFLTRMVHRKLGGNYTFLILTDRDDLDTQIYETFAGCGLVNHDKDPVRASSGENLKELLQAQKRYVFTLIQKFNQELTEGESYSTRNDIIVIADEAHRTQYGTLALNMRDALPNAAFIAFTGTPLFKDDEITRRVFGDYVSTYDFQRAVEDNATLPLYYDARGELLELTTDEVNERVADAIEKAEIEDQDVEQRLQRALRRDYHIITAKKRLTAIARDFVAHWSTVEFDEHQTIEAKGKAMLVCIDKVTCVRMYNYIDAEWQRKIKELQRSLEGTYGDERTALERRIEWMQTTQMAVVVSEAQNEIKTFKKWKLDIVPHRKLIKEGFETADGKRLDVEVAFKKPEHPFRIAIVCAMWLTGFDVPCLSTLYLDKPLKAHTLMQAIARANRVHEGKNNGLIVDYCGILKNLRQALATFAGHGDNSRLKAPGGTLSVDPTKPDEELLEELREAVAFVQAYFEEHAVEVESIHRLTGFARNKAIIDAKEVINENDTTRKRFELIAQQVVKKFKACLMIEGVKAYRPVYNAVHILLKSLHKDVQQADISNILVALHKVVDDAIRVIPNSNPNAERPEPYNISQIDFDRLRQEYERVSTKNTTVQSLKSLIQSRLHRMMQQNPKRTNLQKRYEEIIEAYNNEKNRVTIEQTFQDLLDLAASLDEEQKRAVRQGLTEETLVLFELLSKPDLEASEIARIKRVATDLLDAIRNELEATEQWQAKETTRDAVHSKIYDFLYDERTGLPYPTYSEGDVKRASDEVFMHFLTTYDTAYPSIYATA